MMLDKLRKTLSYDPATGIFRWRTNFVGQVRKGDVAGSLSLGYRYIRFRSGGVQKRYLASKLAWFYMTGVYPKFELDHKNGQRDDNRFKNLRRTTRSQNLANRRKNKNNTTGFKGVVLLPHGRWRAQIIQNYKHTHLGCFDSPIEAHAAYIKAARQMFGEYARSG